MSGYSHSGGRVGVKEEEEDNNSAMTNDKLKSGAAGDDRRRGRLVVTIVKLQDPPPLNGVYWKPKEGLVLMEQHMLLMIRFNATVCHPHRCVLVIMETLGFGLGRGDATMGGGCCRCDGDKDGADEDVDNNNN